MKDRRRRIRLPSRRSLAAPSLLALLCAAPAAAQFTLDDSLRGSTLGNASGGSFGPDGWTVTDRTDRIWYAIPTLASGAVEFSVAGVTPANLTLEDHELFTMYEAGYGIAEPINYNPEYRNNHYKCMVRVYGTAPGIPVERQGTQKLMWGLCPSGAPGYDACGCASFFEEPAGGDPAWDGAPQRLRVEWGGGHARFLRNGAVVFDIDYSASGLEFGPSATHFTLGSPRAMAVDMCGLPVGAVFSDLLVTGTEGPTAVCPGGADADADADADGGACDPDFPMQAVSLDPSSGRGAEQVFRAVYRHCAGAGAFRVVQFLVADAIDTRLPNLSGSYEAGLFRLGTASCAPGSSDRLNGVYGWLDCARGAVAASGNDLIVDWPLGFDVVAFAGEHRFYVDARGPAGTPEPHLGWTRMGSWIVGDAGAADADGGGDVPRDDGGGPGDATDHGADGTVAPAGTESGCGCRLGASSGCLLPPLLLLAMGLAVRRRRASHAPTRIATITPK